MFIDGWLTDYIELKNFSERNVRLREMGWELDEISGGNL